MHQRLFEITMLLAANGQSTAAELAQRFGVSVRTIFRDIDALSSAGVPVYTERGKYGGVYILPEYVLDKTLFTKQEQGELLSYFDGLAQLKTPGAQPVLDKLAALFGRRESWLEVDFTPWGGGEELHEWFCMLRDAIIAKKLVRFCYSSLFVQEHPEQITTNKRAEHRTVEPWRVVFRGQGWYLLGYCHLRNDWRFFKLGRMRNLQVLEEKYSPSQRTPPVIKLPKGKVEKIVILLTHKQKARIEDELPHAMVTSVPDGYRAEFDMQIGEWLIGYILGFGASATVLEPQWLRDGVAQEAEKLWKNYQ